MTRRSELHSLVRNLRQYLEWQGAPLSASVPADADEREQWEAAHRARGERKLRASLDSVVAEKPAPAPPKKKKGETPTAAAPWKDDQFGSGPRPTFAQPEPAVAPAKSESTASGRVHETLAAIREDLGDCKRCGLCEGRTNIVFGVGNPNARLMFVGEAPGFNEDKQGEPFVGKAGALLDKMIEAMGLERSDVYIANVLKCRPPNNRDPAPEEVATCAPFLERQVASIGPEVIVALGKFASNMLSATDGSLGRIRGVWQTYEGVPVMPTYHPAYLLRNPGGKRQAWDDLQKVMARLGLERPN